MKTHLKLAAAALTLALCSAPAFAQTVPPLSASAAEAEAAADAALADAIADAPPAPAAPQIDPEALRIAEQIVLLSLPVGDDNALAARIMRPQAQRVVATLLDSTEIKAAIEGNSAFRGAITRLGVRMEAQMIEQFEANLPELRRITAAAMARRFSVTQLQDLARFYATPSGTAIISAEFEMLSDPELVALQVRTAQRSQQAMLPLLGEMVEEMTAAAAKVD